jgi:hypothetical protein
MTSEQSPLTSLAVERIDRIIPHQQIFFEGNFWEIHTVKFLCKTDTRSLSVFCEVGGESSGNPEKSYVERRLYVQIEDEKWSKITKDFTDAKFAGPYPQYGYHNRVEVTNFNNFYNGKHIVFSCLYRNSSAHNRYFDFFVTRYY